MTDNLAGAAFKISPGGKQMILRTDRKQPRTRTTQGTGGPESYYSNTRNKL